MNDSLFFSNHSGCGLFHSAARPLWSLSEKFANQLDGEFAAFLLKYDFAYLGALNSYVCLSAGGLASSIDPALWHIRAVLRCGRLVLCVHVRCCPIPRSCHLHSGGVCRRTTLRRLALRSDTRHHGWMFPIFVDSISGELERKQFQNRLPVGCRL